MKFRAIAVAALLAGMSASSFALVTRVYNNASFVPAVVGDGYVLNGFGRAADGLPPASAKGQGVVDAVREAFHDIQNIDVSAMVPGLYQLTSHEILAQGSVLFFGASLNSFDETGARIVIDLDVLDDGTKLVGTGPFAVRASCPIASCVWIDLYGTQEIGDTLADYTGTITAQVPEPASYALMLGGLSLFAALARRRQSSPT